MWRLLLFLLFILYGIQALSAESRTVIAMIDTGISSKKYINPYKCNIPPVDVTGTNYEDYHGHGTNIAYLITRGLDPAKYCILSVKFWHSNEWAAVHKKDTADVFVQALQQVVAYKPKFLNLSLSGEAFMQDELNLLKDLLFKYNTKIAVASGNNKKYLGDVCDTFPACYNLNTSLFRVVTTLGVSLANIGGPARYIANGVNQCTPDGICMTGTSQATANYLNWWIKRSE
jgi:hypothetical protein